LQIEELQIEELQIADRKAPSGGKGDPHCPIRDPRICN
jgi:hypothetical protein